MTVLGCTASTNFTKHDLKEEKIYYRLFTDLLLGGALGGSSWNNKKSNKNVSV